MTAINDSLYSFFTGSGLINSLVYQEGIFREGKDNGYFVLKPNGGGSSRPWLRMPTFTVYLFGDYNAPEYGLPSSIGEIANNLIEYITDNAKTDSVIFMEMTEPQTLKRTDSNRPALQMTLTVKS